MTNEIPRQEWERFFGSISRSYLDWQTSVEVPDEETGARIRSENLPLMSFIAEEKNGECELRILLGDSVSNRIYRVGKPRKVWCRRDLQSLRGTIEIEDESRRKTLIRIIQPKPAPAVYFDHQINLRTF